MWSRTFAAAASSARRGHLRRPALRSERRRRHGAVSDTPSTRRRIGESRFDAIDAAPYRPFRRRHQAAKKEKRHVCVEDLAAVAEDLVKTGVARHESLGIRGGSNGGLLVGNFYVQRPELVGAVVCAVPLLDMKRYSHLLAGASWRAEYGDPDTDDWSYLKHNSAYHNVDATKAPFPKLLMTTSTKDDRVHPYHARSFVKRLQELGVPDVYYYENIEGGHGGAADAKQSAYVVALYQDFLFCALGGKRAGCGDP